MSQNISGANGVTRTGNLDNSSEGGATETVNGISQENFGVSNATQTADMISSLGGNASGANGPLWAAGLDSFSENNSSSAGGAIGTVNIISQENLSGSDVTQTANLISSLEENSGANRSIQVENLDNSMEDETGSVDEDGSSEDEHFEIEDMSYENLVLLENVKCTASSAILKTLIGHTFMKNIPSSKSLDELCTICQDKFKDGDSLMILHCSHAYHEACGLEWFLNHSKLCPVCKHDVTDGHL